MKISLTTIALILIFYSTQAQEKKIKVVYNKSNIISSYNEMLIANNKNAIYWNEEVTKNDGITEIKDEESSNRKIINRNLQLFKNEIILSKNNEITIRIHDPENFRDILDKLPEYHWKIFDNETKKIGQYECIKATCNFRGTDIIAYYTPEIPIPFGPWKFKDLPGLILEINVADHFLETKWVVEKIIYPFDNKDESITNTPSRTITLQEEIQNEEILFKKSNELLESRLPEDVTLVNSKRERIDIEKKYEWEE